MYRRWNKNTQHNDWECGHQHSDAAAQRDRFCSGMQLGLAKHHAIYLQQDRDESDDNQNREDSDCGIVPGTKPRQKNREFA